LNAGPSLAPAPVKSRSRCNYQQHSVCGRSSGIVNVLRYACPKAAVGKAQAIEHADHLRADLDGYFFLDFGAVLEALDFFG
jgi:hypothetical protein